MRFNELQKVLNELPQIQVIKLIKGLHDLSPQNKVWLQRQLFPDYNNVEYLEACRKKVIKAVFDPARVIPKNPLFKEAKKVISEYNKSTNDLCGTLDLMLTYVERGHAFTNAFGDIDEPFYTALINMLGKFSSELMTDKDGEKLYALFRDRLMDILDSSDIGWGYGDFIRHTVDGLDKIFGE